MKRVLSLALALIMMVSCMAMLTACPEPAPTPEAPAGPVYDPNAEYTYNSYASTFPTKWNNHTYETDTDSTIIGYCELGFYTFDYNEAKDGFTIVPEMTTQMPIDVTADYAGDEWGIDEDETARAWKLVLRDDLKWEDGTPITAYDFVTSAQLLLNPKANNHRADSLYKGEMVLVGAQRYFYGGKYVQDANPMIGEDYYTIADLSTNEDGQLSNANGDLWFNYKDGCSWSSNSLYDYYRAGYLAGAPAVQDAFVAAAKTADSNGFIKVTAEVAEMLMAATAVLHGYATPEAYAEKAGDYAYTEWNEFCYYGATYSEVDFDTVGIRALSDTELVLILEDPLEGFYLHYNLTGSWLVHEPTYTANMSWDNGVYNNTYGTSVDTYMSYGPYKLTTFIQDKQIVMEKNPQWYGYSDPAYANTYWTTRIVIDWIDDPETAMLAFLKGELDSKGLDVDQIVEYGSSKHVYYTDGASTFFVAMNPDSEAFTEWEADNPGKDKHIMTVKEFRMALSFSLDRKAFNLACDPTGNSAFAVFNDMICSDPETGTMYRTTEYAKDAILKFWGISQDDIGAGKLYATKDEAIDSITGYNLDAAKELFNAAYDKAIADGLMSETDVVEICIGLPSAQAKFYVNGYEFLKNCWTEAVKGTKLEGKLTFTKDDTIGNEFADKLKINQVNLLFGVGWSGSSLNPYNLMMAYTTPEYQYDVSAWDTSVETMDFELNGKTYRATVEDWTYAMMGYEIEIAVVGEDGMATDEVEIYSCGLNDHKEDERLRLFAALEGAVLETYDLLPLNNESSAALKGMQIKYGTEEYVYGVGRGGVKYMQYWYTDAEWDAFVQSQGGTLNYK